MKILNVKKEYDAMTAEEEKMYTAEPKKEVYGKYGNLALEYLKEHNKGKYWALAGNLPEYLHGIDKQAEELYDVMYEKLSKVERYKHTSDFFRKREKRKRD